jgi:hypothetical protein
MTNGRGKERMESGSNKERMNLSTWMDTAIMSSNTYVVDYFTGAQSHSAEGELRRVLEFAMNDVLTWEPHEIEIIKSLADNYAVAGHMLVEYMVQNLDKLKELVPQVVRRMYGEYRATNDERFWMAAIGASVAAGILFSDEHCGAINIPMQPVLDTFGNAVRYMRNAINTGTRSAEDVLNSFTQEYYGNFIIVKFNSTDGGVILPRGISIVGLDLKKCILSPTYIPTYKHPGYPSAQAGTNQVISSVFKWSGNSYLNNFSAVDKIASRDIDQVSATSATNPDAVFHSTRPHGLNFNDYVYVQFASDVNQATGTFTAGYYYVNPIDTFNFNLAASSLNQGTVPPYIQFTSIPQFSSGSQIKFVVTNDL